MAEASFDSCRRHGSVSRLSPIFGRGSIPPPPSCIWHQGADCSPCVLPLAPSTRCSPPAIRCGGVRKVCPLSVRIGSFRYSSRSIRGHRPTCGKPFAEKVLTHIESYLMTSLEMTREPLVNRRIAQIFNKISRITRTSIQDESLTIARSWGPLWGATPGSDGNRSLPVSASRCGAFVGTVDVVMNTPFTAWRSALSGSIKFSQRCTADRIVCVPVPLENGTCHLQKPIESLRKS